MRGLLVQARGRAAHAARLLLLAAAALCVGRAADAAPPLRLCADPANLPFSSDQAGTPGLYLEIGQRIAQALGRELEPVWSLSYWGKRNLRTTLLAGRCDLAIGLPADPGFMGPRLVLSKPVLEMGYALVTPKDRVVRRLEELKGMRVAVQFASPPQSLLATHGDITTVTVMSAEEGMRRLAGGQADAAILWGPVAGYVNRAVQHDRWRVVPLDGPGMHWEAAIGFARKEAALREAVARVLDRVRAEVPALAARYGLPEGPRITLAAAGPAPSLVLVADDTAAAIKEGRDIFNGTCAHCHGPDAVQSERRINLRLLHHRYGDDMEQVFFTTVTHGRPAKGMPNWSGVFTHDDFVKIFAFLKSVQTKD